MKEKMIKIMMGGVVALTMLHATETPIEIYTTLTTKNGLVLKGTNKGLIVEGTINFKVPNLELNSTKNAPVYALSEQKDGKILIGGNFDTINDYPRKDLVRINDDGSLDESFMVQNEGFDGEVYDIIVLENKDILVGGYFEEYDENVNLKGLIKLNQYGLIKSTYDMLNIYDHGVVTDIEKIGAELYLAGSFTKNKQINNTKIHVSEKPLLLINKKGLDNEFNKRMSILDGTAFKIIKDKKSLIIVGDFASSKDENIQNIVKVSKNGKIKKSFKANTDGVIYDAKIENNTLKLYGDLILEKNVKSNSSDTVVLEKLPFSSAKFGTSTQGLKMKQYKLQGLENYSSRGCTPYISVASKTRDYWFGKQKAYSWTRLHTCGNASSILTQHFLYKGPDLVGYGEKEKKNTNFLYYSSYYWFADAGTLYTLHDVIVGGHLYSRVLGRGF